MFSNSLIYLKVIFVAAVLGATFYAGHHVGSANGDRRAAEAETAAAEAETAAAIAERVHANDMVALQAKHQQILLDAVAANAAKYQAETKLLKEANAQYQKRIDEINSARLAASRRVTAVDGGLWLDVEASTCTGPSGTYSGGDTQAGTGPHDLRGPQVRRCRLSQPSAEFLVAITSEADSLAEKFNLCRNEIRTVNVDVTEEAK